MKYDIKKKLTISVALEDCNPMFSDFNEVNLSYNCNSNSNSTTMTVTLKLSYDPVISLSPSNFFPFLPIVFLLSLIE